MTIIEKIKQTLEPIVGSGNFHYADQEEMNVTLDSASFPCAFSVLVDSGTIEDKIGRFHEGIYMQVWFADLCSVGLSGEETERIIHPQKERALTWLSALRKADDIHLESINRSGRQYISSSGYDVMIAAYMVDITISEKEGFGECGK